jgi:hypothetical protein
MKESLVCKGKPAVDNFESDLTQNKAPTAAPRQRHLDGGASTAAPDGGTSTAAPDGGALPLTAQRRPESTS